MTNKRPALLVAPLVLLLIGGMTQAAKAWPTDRPVDPQASPIVQRLLDYLASPHPIISGQMLGLLDGYEAAATMPYAGITYGYKHRVEGLEDKSGKWVGLVGINYGRMMPCEDRNRYLPDEQSPFMNCTNPPLDYRSAYEAADRVLIDYWEAGGLVTVTWHAPNPWTGHNAHDVRVPGNFSDLYTPGNPMNLTFNRMLDELAEPLTELQRAGVVVLFRPFHENNGNWFWWGYKGSDTQPSAEQFSSLWRYTFEYMTRTKRLNHLLWVYCVNRSGFEGSEDVLVFHPGARYFDIVALDDYKSNNKHEPQPIQSAYQQIRSLGKPIALGEYGPLSPWIDDPSNHFDWLDLINVEKQYPDFSYFMAWGGTPTDPLAIIQDENGAALLNRAGAVTNRDDMHWRREGDAPVR
jgi:mannan endo-1,4-beta-mannosidase